MEMQTEPLQRSYLSPTRSRMSSSLRSPTAPKSPAERVHAKEVERISELFEDTKEEMRKTGRELKAIEESGKILAERVSEIFQMRIMVLI